MLHKGIVWPQNTANCVPGIEVALRKTHKNCNRCFCALEMKYFKGNSLFVVQKKLQCICQHRNQAKDLLIQNFQ